MRNSDPTTPRVAAVGAFSCSQNIMRYLGEHVDTVASRKAVARKVDAIAEYSAGVLTQLTANEFAAESMTAALTQMEIILKHNLEEGTDFAPIAPSVSGHTKVCSALGSSLVCGFGTADLSWRQTGFLSCVYCVAAVCTADCVHAHRIPTPSATACAPADGARLRMFVVGAPHGLQCSAGGMCAGRHTTY